MFQYAQGPKFTGEALGNVKLGASLDLNLDTHLPNVSSVQDGV